MFNQSFATVPVAFYQYNNAVAALAAATVAKNERQRVYGEFTSTARWDSRIESSRRIIARYLAEGGEA